MEAGSLIIIEPESRFKKICRHIIENYEPVVVGVYCKIVTLGAKTRLNIKFLSKVLGVSPAKMRSIIVLLEKDGYIRRVAAKDEKGKMKGWVYYVYPTQVAEKDRTCAGRSSVLSETRVVDSPSCQFSDNTENNKDLHKDYKEIDKENNKEKDKEDINIRVRERLSHKYNKDKPLTDIEVKFYLGMEERYPRVMRMDSPLLYRQYKELLKKGVCNEKIIANLEAMENYKPLKDRVKAYQTLLNFIKIDRNQYTPSIV